MLPTSFLPDSALWSFLLYGFTRAQTDYESIYTLDAFTVQPTCVQDCFIAGYANINCYTDVLGSWLGCPNTPCATAFAAADSCYCRGDLQAAAHELLGSCIDQACSVGDNAVNLATAASIYSTYCQERGFTALPASTTSTPKPQHTSGIVASTIFSDQSGATSDSSSSTSPSTTNDSSAASSQSKTLITILVCVGALALAATVAVAVLYWRHRHPRPPKSSHSTEQSQTELVHQAAPLAVAGANVVPWLEDSMAQTSVEGSQRSVAGR